MDCGTCREALSARLDGEDGSVPVAAVNAHVASCGTCGRWSHDAAEITRIARIGLVVGGTGVSDDVLDAMPSSRRARLLVGLRVVLAILGVGQVALGLIELARPMGDTAAMGGVMTGATPDHLTHESAAWNLAVGAGFLFVAWRRGRPAGIVPLLSVFVGVLTLLSIGDWADGAVAVARLASHLLLVAGYVIIVVMCRPSMAPAHGWYGLNVPPVVDAGWPRAPIAPSRQVRARYVGTADRHRSAGHDAQLEEAVRTPDGIGVRGLDLVERAGVPAESRRPGPDQPVPLHRLAVAEGEVRRQRRAGVVGDPHQEHDESGVDGPRSDDGEVQRCRAGHGDGGTSDRGRQQKRGRGDADSRVPHPD